MIRLATLLVKPRSPIERRRSRQPVQRRIASHCTKQISVFDTRPGKRGLFGLFGESSHPATAVPKDVLTNGQGLLLALQQG
jgi:hypothetical protein